MINVSFKHANPIYFKGTQTTSNIVQDGELKEFVHHSGFLRDFDTLDFTQKYLLDKFPQGTHVAEFGCSEGQKTYSLLLMLDEFNKNEKFKITGYDIAPNVVDIANGGFYCLDRLEYYANESVLLQKPFVDKNLYKGIILTDEKALKLNKTFYEYFYPIRSTESPLIKQYVKFKHQKGSDLIDFKVGDITKIDQILEPEKSGVIIFQNALYHIIDSRTNDGYENIDITPAKILFEKINKVLPENGIFVFGNLHFDHLYEKSCEDQTKLIYQNNERIRVFDSSKIHDALRKSGFEPIFYELGPLGIPINQFKDVHLPAVWKKVSHLK